MTSSLILAAGSTSSVPPPALLGALAFGILLALLTITLIFGHGRPHA